eukprot:gene5879-6801_t
MAPPRTKRILIRKIRKHQRPADIEIYHKGAVLYSLPVLLIRRILRLAWNGKDLKWSLSLGLVSKELFQFVSKQLFTSFTLNNVKSQADARLYYKAFINPNSPFKMIESLVISELSLRRLSSLSTAQTSSMVRNIRTLDTPYLYTWLLADMKHLQKLTVKDGSIGNVMETLLHIPSLTKLRVYNTPIPEQYFLRQTSLTSIEIDGEVSSNSLCHHLCDKTSLANLVFEPTMPFTMPPNLRKLAINKDLFSLNQDTFNCIISIISTNQTLERLHIHIPTARHIDIAQLTIGQMTSTDTIVRLDLKHPYKCMEMYTSFFNIGIKKDIDPTKVTSLTQAILETNIKNVTISFGDESDLPFAELLDKWRASRPSQLNQFSQQHLDSSYGLFRFYESSNYQKSKKVLL